MVARGAGKVADTFQAAFQIPGNPPVTRLGRDAEVLAATGERNSFFQVAFDEIYLLS